MLTVSCKNRVGGRQFCHPRAPSVQCICSGEKFSVGCRIQVRQRICAGQWNFRGRNDISASCHFTVSKCMSAVGGIAWTEASSESRAVSRTAAESCRILSLAGAVGTTSSLHSCKVRAGREASNVSHHGTDRSRLTLRSSGRGRSHHLAQDFAMCALQCNANKSLDVIGNTDSTLGGISVGFVFKLLRRFGPKHRA
jgi:hypothetical protein